MHKVCQSHELIHPTPALERVARGAEPNHSTDGHLRRPVSCLWWLRIEAVAMWGLPLCRVVGFPSGSDGKESACNAGDLDSMSGSRRSPGEAHGNPLQHSCLENTMDRGA